MRCVDNALSRSPPAEAAIHQLETIGLAGLGSREN
jgi:hypothetical protein